MRAVVQRVTRASVRVDGNTVGAVARGVLVYLGVSRRDTEQDAVYLAEKICTLRVFPDDASKFNRALSDVGGAILLVSQFTLYGDCRRGRRPSFTDAAEPTHGRFLYERVAALLRSKGFTVETGIFGAHMEVESINDGPVTILLDSEKTF